MCWPGLWQTYTKLLYKGLSIQTNRWYGVVLPTHAGSSVPTVERQPRTRSRWRMSFFFLGSDSAHASFPPWGLAESRTDVQTDNGGVSTEISRYRYTATTFSSNAGACRGKHNPLIYTLRTLTNSFCCALLNIKALWRTSFRRKLHRVNKMRGPRVCSIVA